MHFFDDNHTVKPSDQLEKNLDLFDQLFKRFYPLLLSFANNYIRDIHASEDVVQDVFMTLWDKKAEIDFETPLKPLLYKITYNRALNYLNSHSVKCRIHQEETVEEVLYRDVVNFNQYDELILQETNRQIYSIIETFPPQCKKVFLLSRQENMKNREIAQQLNICEKTVEKHITKALFEIRSQLLEMELISLLICIGLSK